jgi:hypothetical protein
LLLALGNDHETSQDAACAQVLLATMKAQQAVAIRFVGRRVFFGRAFFFSLDARVRGQSSLMKQGHTAAWTL